MTDPERLLDLDRDGLPASLIRAAREDAPSDRLLGETLLALGVGATVVGAGAATGALAASSASALSKAGAAPSLAIMAAKWLGVGALGGAMTVSAAVGVERAVSAPPARPAATAPARALVVPAPTATSATKPAAPEQVEDAPKPAAPPSVLAPARAATAPSIAEETAAVDRARRELAQGNAAAALATLDEYDRRPGTHRLQQEALLLRMDALARSGNLAAAKTVAKSLLAQDPKGPHAARARRVLGDAKE